MKIVKTQSFFFKEIEILTSIAYALLFKELDFRHNYQFILDIYYSDIHILHGTSFTDPNPSLSSTPTNHTGMTTKDVASPVIS